MMAFAMQNDMMHKKMMWKMSMVQNTNCCLEKNEDNNWCNHSCCISWNSDFQNIILNNHNFEEKILKIKLISFIDIFAESSHFFENKILIRKTSPPNLDNKIKYYSYSDLVKIIKSNT